MFKKRPDSRSESEANRSPEVSYTAVAIASEESPRELGSMRTARANPFPRRWKTSLERLDGLFLSESAVMVLIIAIPLLFVVQRAFVVNSSLSLENFKILIGQAGFRNSLSVTLVGALLGTIGCLIVGTTLAVTAERIDARVTKLFRIVAFLPLLVSPLGGAVAWAILASPSVGILWSILESIGIPLRLDIYTLGGIIFVFVLFYTPYVFIIASTGLAGIDASLEEAGATFGASGWRRFRYVLLPLLKVPLASAGLLVFAIMVESFSIPIVLGRPGQINFISSYAYQSITRPPTNPGIAGATAMVLLAIVLAAYAGRSRVIRTARSDVTVEGKGFREPPRIKPGFIGWLMVVLSSAYLLLAGVAPIVALIVAATRDHLFFPTTASIFDGSLYSLDVVKQYSGEWGPAAVNTIKVAGAVALFGGLLAFLGAYLISRPNSRRLQRNTLEGLTSASFAVPGIVFGLAYLWAGVLTPIYGTLLLMVFAYTAKNLAGGFQALAGRMLQVGSTFQESAAVFGARRRTQIFTITLPLVLANALYASLFLFIAAVRELSSVLFIYTPQNSVLAVQAFRYWYDGRFDVVAVVTLLQTTLMFLALLVASALLRRQRSGERPGRALTA